MKIKLINATFYFNPPVNLTPLQREIDINLDTLSDLEVRKLFLGLSSGVIEITEGKKEYLERYETVRPKKKTETVVPTKVAEVVEPVAQEVQEEVKETVQDEVPTEVVEEKPKTTRTTTKKATAKK